MLATGPPLFKRWTDLMGEDHWHDDPRFRDDQRRGDNGAVFSERMAQWCRERTSEGMRRASRPVRR